MFESTTTLTISGLVLHALSLIVLMLLFWKETRRLSFREFRNWNVSKQYFVNMISCAFALICISLCPFFICDVINQACQAPEFNKETITWLFLIAAVILCYAIYIFISNLVYRAERMLMILEGTQTKKILKFWKWWIVFSLVMITISLSVDSLIKSYGGPQLPGHR